MAATAAAREQFRMEFLKGKITLVESNYAKYN
jgi:hypothetical protein